MSDNIDLIITIMVTALLIFSLLFMVFTVFNNKCDCCDNRTLSPVITDDGRDYCSIECFKQQQNKLFKSTGKG